MNVAVYFNDPKHVQAWRDMFEPTDVVVAHHELYKEVVQKRPDVALVMSKFVFYICNFTVFGNPTEKDVNGCLGYRLHFKATPGETDK